jgi:DNA-directed RNA polymerase specialized sigma24 family protein
VIGGGRLQAIMAILPESFPDEPKYREVTSARVRKPGRAEGIWMAKNDGISDGELEELFRDPDRRFAVQMLDAYRRENMWRYILSICRYFDDDDIHEVYVQSLREFIASAKRPDFDPKDPLRLFQHIAKLRAIDRARRKSGRRIKSAGDLIEPLAVDLKDTKLSLEWRLVIKEEWPKFRKALDEVIDELPPKQRMAALGVLEVYEEMRARKSPEPLAAWIRRMTGEDCTASQAADRWRAAKEKIEEKLTRAGFRSLFEDYQ